MCPSLCFFPICVAFGVGRFLVVLRQVMTAVKHAEALSQIGTGGGLQTGREQPLQSPKDPAVDSEIPEIRRWMSVLEFHAFWGYVDRIRNEPQECLVNHVESRVITCRH